MKHFAVVHLVPFLQVIALFGLIPLYTTSSGVVEETWLGAANLTQFFMAIALSIVFFISRPYQIISIILLVLTYFIFAYNSRGLLYLDQVDARSTTIEETIDLRDSILAKIFTDL